MTELYERLLTDRREALAKRRTVYFTRTRRISVRNYSADWLFYLRKRKIFKNLFSFKTSFQLL